MRTRLSVGALMVAFCGGVAYVIGARETWGPDVALDPTYKNGRASVCEARAAHPGDTIAAHETTTAPRAVGRGSEQSISYSFDGTGLERGVIDVCSEYGSIELVGSDEGTGRVDVVLRNPFPYGDRAVNDTRLVADLRRDGNHLSIGVRQLTQGVTSFRSWFRRGSRPTLASIRITLPKQAEYLVHLVANHHYLIIADVVGRASSAFFSALPIGRGNDTCHKQILHRQTTHRPRWLIGDGKVPYAEVDFGDLKGGVRNVAD